jgi:hypothetical protein
VESDGARGAFWDAIDVLSVNGKLSQVPATDEAAVRELAYEHMKVAYIRRVKGHYTNRGYDCGYATLLAVVALWLLSVITA